MQNFCAFCDLDIEKFFLDSHFLELLMLISAMDELLYLLPRLEWIYVHISSHVKVVVLEVALLLEKLTNYFTF